MKSVDNKPGGHSIATAPNSADRQQANLIRFTTLLASARPIACPSCRRRQRARFSADRHRKGRPCIDRSLPALELRIGRALDRKPKAALYDRAERNVGDGEAIEREPIAPGEVAVENFELGEKIGALRGEIGRATLNAA
jgi:hypothetical protein